MFETDPSRKTLFAELLLPVPVPRLFTYRVPLNLNDHVKVGQRAIVQFGDRKIVTGLVYSLHEQPPRDFEAKYILELLDEFPAVNELQLRLFGWIADYYMCTLGEVMTAALPAGLKLSSESMVQLHPGFSLEESTLDFSEKEAMLIKRLEQGTMTYSEISKFLGVKFIFSILKSLSSKEAIILFEEVKQAKQEAEMASKIAEKANAAKSAFLSTVSHELRTPLTSVLGFAKIIRKRLEEKIFPAVQKADNKVDKTINQISENLQVVIAEGERLTHLINDVLDLAKIEAGKMEWNFETVSIAEIVDRAISASSSLFEQKSLNFEKYIEPDLPAVSGDRDKLIQVIINLISNSVKFTDTGSVSCRVYRKNEEVIVSISDTGIGIAEEDFAAVFEQFKQVGGDTLTDKPKGTGLGLPICKEIIEHHGGRIWLESEVGKGSTFSFALPVTKATSIKPINLDDLVKQLKEQMTQSKISTSGKAASILIVDDDDSIRSLLQQELSEGGYLIEEATNGKEALERIRKNRPDLIILDVMMPEMNGFDVAAILKNDPQTMDIPIIVLSIVQDKIRGYRIGVDRYLTKPIDTAQLFTEVGALLQQGKSKKKVMVVDEDSTAIRSLTDVLEAKGYNVVESNGNELVEKAIAAQPDIIILNSIYSGKQEMVQALRFEKGLENVLFLMYQ